MTPDPDQWFILRFIHIHDTLWQADAIAVGLNPLVAHTAYGSGPTIPDAEADLWANILSNQTVPPPECPSIASPNELNLRELLGLTPIPTEPTKPERRF